MPKLDLDRLRPHLDLYLKAKGVKYNAAKKKWQCPNPAHADENPSATLYDGERLNCNVCDDKAWDIFAVAGLICGIMDFKDQVKEVQDTLGIYEDSPSTQKQTPPQKTPPKSKPQPVALERDKALNIFDVAKLNVLASKTNWLDGKPDVKKMWPYYNADGLIDIVDVRYENEDGKKAVITFYYDGKSVRTAGAPVLLYNRHRIASEPDAPILIVEGAKAAQAADALEGFVPVTWNGGGKKCKQVDWSVLKDRTVYIYPDDDLKVYDKKHAQAGKPWPWHTQPGIAAAFDIKNALPQAKIITPPEQARTIKADGADIVEALEVMSADELKDYILTAPELIHPRQAPPPGAQGAQGSPLDTQSTAPETKIFPFRVLGVADDGKAYFLDRHDRLVAVSLGSITQNKLLTLAPLPYWQEEYANGRGGLMSRDDWTTATDDVIEVAGRIDFDPDIIRGRGAWREVDGSTCYHDGLSTIGTPGPKRLYLRMTRKDIGLGGPHVELSALDGILAVTELISFETVADMIRCLAWCTLAPFAGALPWRPAGLLTGPSGTGKSEIVNLIIKPLTLPHIFTGGESTEAGIRQDIGVDSVAVVIDEADADTGKKRINRDNTMSLMRQSTSDQSPKVAKGTIDGKGLKFTVRSAFLFAAIDPEVEAVADDNRIFLINLKDKRHAPEQWFTLKKELQKAVTPEVCAGIRALTWTKLDEIFELAARMSPIIEEIAKKPSRFAISESLLFAAYNVVWKQVPVTDEMMREFFTKIYAMQKPEETRDVTAELLDRLLDHVVQDGRDRFSLREVLKNASSRDHTAERFKTIAGHYGLGINADEDLAMAKNHHEIMNIINMGKRYSRSLKRHPQLKDENKTVHFGGKARNCLVFNKIVIEGEPF